MATPIFQAGGVAGLSTKIAVNDDGSMTVTDATGAALFTLSSAGALTLAAGLALTSITATGNVALGNATSDAHSITGTVARNGLDTVTVQTVTVDGAETLVIGTPSAGQTQITSNWIALNNTAGSSQNVTLDSAANLSGKYLLMVNVSANDCVIKDSGGTTLATLTSGKGALFVSNGTGIGKVVGA